MATPRPWESRPETERRDAGERDGAVRDGAERDGAERDAEEEGEVDEAVDARPFRPAASPVGGEEMAPSGPTTGARPHMSQYSSPPPTSSYAPSQSGR
ncbi:hypothetical protein [Streptomyces montanisoli]|uniref:hypothetical protein n=1 Tax=Streptomyces montanisoli TaxID=2798581 RepID=UPI003FD754C7